MASIYCVQHSLCLKCSKFLCMAIELKAIDESNTLMYHEEHRKSAEVANSAALDCWLCSTIIAHAKGRSVSKKITFTGFGGLDPAIEIESRGSVLGTGDARICDLRLSTISPDEVPKPETHPRSQVSTWSKKTCDIANGWLSRCDNDHPDCISSRLIYSKELRPRRLLGLAEVAAGLVSVVASESVAENQPYAALSHCWGNCRVATLTQANLSSYQAGIRLSSLPKTFIDAAKVCQDLGIRYLWIDSLCIIQDSQEDWKQEAPRMADIYSCAVVTIAASAATGDAEGFVRPRNPLLDSHLVFYRPAQGVGMAADRRTYYRLQRASGFWVFVEEARLNTRAWVLQERILSRRILYFAEDQVYWQCPSSLEAASIQGREEVDPEWKQQRSVMKGITREMADSGEALLGRGRPQWHELVMAYSKLHLTFRSDKQVAISGLASRLARVSGWQPTDYLAGHWRPHLLHGLLWKINEKDAEYIDRASVCEGPSWSWAATNSPVIYADDIFAKILEAENGNSRPIWLAQVVDAEAPATVAFGPAKHGRLVLRCKLAEMRILMALPQEFHVYRALTWTGGGGGPFATAYGVPST